MNWDQVKGRWNEMRGQARQKWGDLTDDELDKIEGKREELVGTLQRKYGIGKEEAEKQADEFAASMEETANR